MKKFITFLRKTLIISVVFSVLLGIIFGQFAPFWFVRIFTTFNVFFSSILSFTVPLLILALITGSIAETDRNAGKMLIWTIALAYVSTVLAGILTYFVADLSFPGIVTMHANDNLTSHKIPEGVLDPYFKIDFPPVMDTMSSLLLAFILGFAIVKFNHHAIKQGVIELKDVVMMIVSDIILPLLPLYIFGVFLKMTVSGEMDIIVNIYLKVILIMLAIFVLWVLIQYVIAGIVSKQNPLKALWKMMPALLTALASSSSAATLPVTLRCAQKMNVRKNVIDFVIPMCANIHLSGAAVRTVSLAIATMLMFQQPFTFGLFFNFILIFSITVLAAPGIPGGVIMAAAGLIQSMLGFNDQMIALMITLSIALDSLGTAVNVVGDGALMLIVNKVTEHPETSIQTQPTNH